MRCKRNERFFLVRQFDLDNGRSRDLRVLGSDHVQPRKSCAFSRPQIDHLRAFDQAARLEIQPFFTVLQRQFDPVADQRLPRQQLVRWRAIGGTEGMDQANARCVAPDQHRRSRHQLCFDPLRHDDTVVATGSLFDHPLEFVKTQGLV